MLALLLAALAVAAEPVLAIAPFSANTASEDLTPFAAGLSDMLTTDVGEAEAVTIVERARLDAILSELELRSSDWADPATAVQLGKGLGATAVLVGSMSQSGGTVRLDARLVDVESGRVVASVEQEGAVDDVFHLERQLALRVLEKLDVPLTSEHRARLGALAPKEGETGTGFDDAGAAVTLTQLGITQPWGHLFVDGQYLYKIKKKVPSTVKLVPGRHEFVLAVNDKGKSMRCWGVIDVPANGLNLTTAELCQKLQPGPSPYGTLLEGGVIHVDEPIDVGLSTQVDGMYWPGPLHNVTAGVHTVVASVKVPGTIGSTEICRETAVVPKFGLVVVSVTRLGCKTTVVDPVQ